MNKPSEAQRARAEYVEKFHQQGRSPVAGGIAVEAFDAGYAAGRADAEKLAAALEFYANRHEYSAAARVGSNLWACVALDFFKPAEEALREWRGENE